MYFDWRKVIKLFITTGILLCACVNFSTAQKKLSPVNPQTTIDQAIAAFERGDLSNAKILLRKTLSADPRNAIVHTLLGAIADRENDLKAAELHFAQAAKLSPKSPETRNNYGAILIRLNRKAEAAKEFTASLAANPNQPSALVNLAQIRVDENDLPAARLLFEKVRIILPDLEILRALILISLKLNDKTRAAQDYLQYSALGNSQVQLAARVELGSAFLESGLYSEAIAELESAFAIAPNDNKVIVLLSRAHLARKDIKNAGLTLESAVARGIDEAEIYAALADVYEAGGYYENAIPAMRRAIEKEPKNDLYRSRYGLLLVNSKAPAAAVIRVEEALKEFPDSAYLWFALGIAQFDDNKISEAQKAFEKTLSLNSQLVPALAYLGAVFVEQARYADAVTIYERAIKLNGKIPLLHYLLGDTLLKLTDVDDKRIEAALRRAAELDANLTSAHLNLGRLYVRQARWVEAATFLERAAKLEPNRAETFYQLGRVYARLKRADESKTALERFKQLNDSQKQQKEVDRRELVRRLANVRF
jgi:Tfp pilus assembly protein PilF